jgi:hypothetical protein
MDEFSALCFTWNTQSVRMAESMGCGTVEFSLTGCKRYEADFIPPLVDRIVEAAPSVFVCALQEDAKPGSHLISHALPLALKTIGYTLLKRARWIGVGCTTLQRLCGSGELIQRGLRMAVFASDTWLQSIPTSARSMLVYETSAWPATGFDAFTRGKGGLAITLVVPGIGRVSFLNCHLPFYAASVAETNSRRIENGLMTQTRALERLIAVCEKEHCSDHLIVLGDLNFRVLNFSHGIDAAAVHDALSLSLESRKTVYKTRDELRLAIDYGAVTARLREGISNAGPAAFMPTGKMRHGRDAGAVTRDAYYFGDDAAQNPSWCDRILYCSRNSEHHTIQCTAYDRFESGITMTRSDHSAVTALLRIYTTRKIANDVFFPHSVACDSVNGFSTNSFTSAANSVTSELPFPINDSVSMTRLSDDSSDNADDDESDTVPCAKIGTSAQNWDREKNWDRKKLGPKKI